MCSFSLRSHGHSCDRVTNTSPWNLTSFLCKYLHINMLYNYTSISLSQRSHGHSCDRVTIYPTATLSIYRYKYLYINMLYILYCCSCALRSHGHSCDHVTVTVWPWLWPDSQLRNLVISCKWLYINVLHTTRQSLVPHSGHTVTAVTMWPWPCDRFAMT